MDPREWYLLVVNEEVGMYVLLSVYREIQTQYSEMCPPQTSAKWGLLYKQSSVRILLRKKLWKLMSCD